MAFQVENLGVYQKSLNFAVSVFAACEQFPPESKVLADQLQASALRVATSIASGNPKQDTAERLALFTSARDSVQWCVPLLEIARRRRLISDSIHQRLESDLDEMSRMLSGLIRGVEDRPSPSPKPPHNLDRSTKVGKLENDS